MDKLYKEVSMKHPRKIKNGKIEKYSFFSWTGFFCFKKIKCLEKNEFNNLPFGITSYFKTIKLFIFTFLIISLINLIGIIYYSQHKSIYKNLKFLQKTTLSNTMTSTYNSILFYYKIIYKKDKRNKYLLSFKCKDNKKIGKSIKVVRFESDYFYDYSKFQHLFRLYHRFLLLQDFPMINQN